MVDDAKGKASTNHHIQEEKGVRTLAPWLSEEQQIRDTSIQVPSSEEWERTALAFVEREAFGPSKLSGLSVRVEDARAILDWHEAEECGKLRQMDLAMWDGRILTIHGPSSVEGSACDRWRVLTSHDLADARFNLIAYLIEKALANVHKMDWKQRWERVKNVVPDPCLPDELGGGGFLCWCFSTSWPGCAFFPNWPYPFECDIAGEGAPLLRSPSPDRVIDDLARRAVLDRPSVNTDSFGAFEEETALVSLVEMVNGWGISISEQMKARVMVRKQDEIMYRATGV